MECLEPLGHLHVGAALDDVLHHGGLDEQHAEGDVDADGVRVDHLDLLEDSLGGESDVK